MTPEEYNRSRLNRIWSLLSIPSDWDGREVLVSADTGQDLALDDAEADAVDWPAFSGRVEAYQSAHSAAVPDAKLGPNTFETMVRRFGWTFPAPDVSALEPRDRLRRVAESQLGVREYSGVGQHNPVIVKYSDEIGYGGIVDDETAWCSIFANWCALKAELPRSGELNARSWLDVGEEVGDPEPGDVVVFWRDSRESWKGHVAFFQSFTDDGNIAVLGGNQGNRVCVLPYARERLLGYRRLV